jgi:uncharacterized protein YfaS (alpha-2-macroglobulin family)
VQVKIESPLMKLDRTFPLQVQAPTPRQTVLKRFTVNPGETLEVKRGRSVWPGRLPQADGQRHAGGLDQAPIDVRSAVQGLLTYPYGCAEQTTSSAYPHVFIDEAAAKQFGLKPFTQAQRAEMLDKAIARLAGMQAPNGGFSLWGNVNEYQYWLSAYISNFLLDAREQGFTCRPKSKRRPRLPAQGLAGGRCRPADGPSTTTRTRVWNDWRYAGSGRFAVLAYGAYVLARQGKAPLATLRTAGRSQRAGALRPWPGAPRPGAQADGRRSAQQGRHRRRPQEAAASTTPGGATTAATCATGRRCTCCCKSTS